ncbi:MAG TPA: type II and III secretion system protein family protein [Acetobacteraceae bacterium]|nr:type II and III secretion system protein family protein [Acetobacteraceae bacterium]
MPAHLSGTPRHALLAALLLLAAASLGAVAAPVNPDGVPHQRLELETGGGKLLRLSGAAASVFVADPKVAEVHPANAGMLFLFGVGPGRTDVVAVDAAGATLLDAQVTVRPSGFAASQAEAEVRRALPGSHVSIRPKVKGLIVTGRVATPEDAARVLAIARGYVAAGDTVEDQLGVMSSVQVLLRVRLVEMSRSVARDLGVNWQALGSIGRFSVNFATANALAATLGGTAANRLQLGTPDVNGIIDALAQDNLAHILAEPNLTAMSGQPASFLAGGEFPIPVGQQNNQVSIEFKKYGVQLTFVPTVLAGGRIDLHVRPEVSELTTQGAVQLTAANSSLQIPALTVRRAETTVELGSGQSFAIAGLLQDSVTQGTSAVPGIGEIPILGTLFRSDSFQRQQTELVVVVTPYVVRPADDPAALHVPGENYHPPSDFERILELRQMGAGHPAAPARVPGEAGFIVQ